MHGSVEGSGGTSKRRIGELEAESSRLRLALARAEDQLHALLASATDYAIITTDLEGRVTAWNAGARHVLGWDAPEVLGQPLAIIYTPEDREAGIPAEETGHALIEGGASDERWHVRRGGERFWGQGRVMPLRSVEAPGFLKILRDGTERRRTLDALRESEARLQLAQDAAEVGIWDWDLATGQVRWTDTNYRLWGLTSDDSGMMAAERVLRAIHPDDQARVRVELGQAISGGGPFRSEFRVVTASGDVRWLAGLGRPMPGAAGGQVERMIGANLDVTARRETELELERRVAERTAELAESQARLAQSQKMEAIGRLTGGIAHDFNNLLAAVIGGLDLIARQPGDADRVLRLADAARGAAHRGAKLTGQLLAFSRTQRLAVAPVDVNRLLHGLEALLAQSVAPRARVHLDLTSDAGYALADANQLELAVLNLAINARDAMPAGGTIRVRTAPVAWPGSPGDAPAPGDYVEVAVEDDGTGMDETVRARAFEPFFTTKPAGQGTGLGLAQVYGIVRQAGGDVRIESAPSRGTTVRLLLPRVREGTDGEREAGTDGGGLRTEAAPAAFATILVVDDDPDVREFLRESLESFGYRALLAESGEAALRMLDEVRPDLALVDFAMPGLSGAAVAEAARARHPGLPVVFATGYADTATLEAARAGAPVLRKPFAVAELETVLARFVASGS